MSELYLIGKGETASLDVEAGHCDMVVFYAETTGGRKFSQVAIDRTQAKQLIDFLTEYVASPSPLAAEGKSE